MTPEVRYAASHDGWRIAYSVHGEGPPVFLCTGFVGSHPDSELGRPNHS